MAESSVENIENRLDPAEESTKAEQVSVENGSAQRDDKEFIEIIFNLENEKLAIIEDAKSRIRELNKKLEESRTENEVLKKKIAQLEQTAMQKAAMGGDSSTSKKDFDEILAKAKTLLFEKTKVCKQQEQHIEVLKNQVDSVKEVLAITKDMLNLRNSEVDHLQTRLDTIDVRIKAEKDNRSLLEKKLAISQKMFTDLRAEYDCQSKIFKELRCNYEQKNKILENELEKAKASSTKT